MTYRLFNFTVYIFATKDLSTNIKNSIITQNSDIKIKDIFCTLASLVHQAKINLHNMKTTSKLIIYKPA